MAVHSKGECFSCKNGTLPNNVAIGKKVLFTHYVGRGHDSTELSFFQCDTCGMVWQRTIDSGAGGHGTYDSKISRF